MFDLRTGRWSRLPKPPAGVVETGGAVGDLNDGFLTDRATWLLDAPRARWRAVPNGDTGSSHSIVVAGRRIIAFGGARFPRSGAKHGIVHAEPRVWNLGPSVIWMLIM